MAKIEAVEEKKKRNKGGRGGEHTHGLGVGWRQFLSLDLLHKVKTRNSLSHKQQHISIV